MVLAVQRQITSQKLVLKIMFRKSISYTYCIAPRKKIYSGCFFRYECDMILTKTKKKGRLPKLESLGIELVQEM